MPWQTIVPSTAARRPARRGARASRPIDAGELRPSVGPASDLQIAFEKLKRAANVNMIYVPYPGVAPAVNALLGEHVTSIMTSYLSASEQLKAGKLRALAMTTRARIDAMPDVPTVAESGYPDYESEPWFGPFAPSKTPREIISQLSEWFSTAARTPEVCEEARRPGALSSRDLRRGFRRSLAASSGRRIRIIWPTLDEAGTFGALVKALLLTAQRREEVAQMSRKEIGEDAIWEIPAERYKTKRPNFVPLSKAALAVINARPKIENCDYVFPSRARTPFSGFGKSKAALDKAVVAAMKKRTMKRAKAESLPNWTLHDLRRTAKTLMAR